MLSRVPDRRINHRYELHLPLHYRVSEKGVAPRWGSGTTKDLSTSGLSFRCRKPLPVGSHVEIVIDWPARNGDNMPVDLQITGFVLRSDSNRTAVRITSHRFRVNSATLEQYRVSA